MEEDLRRPATVEESDCTTSKKGTLICKYGTTCLTYSYSLVACKNCVCGRAEMEQQEEAKKVRLTPEMLERPGLDSSCGSVCTRFE